MGGSLELATKWLGETRARDPKKFAFFTGRDQSQALTGWFAQQYGTPNFAAHGGFCSVNMAAAGLYTFGGSFWEFGEPDWKHTKYFLLFGVAEDHASNPLKIALGDLKTRGVKVVSINPVRTGYNAIADEWVGIRPGTDGLFVASLIHELMKAQKIDVDYLARYTNSSWLVIDAPGEADDGLIARDKAGAPLAFSRKANAIVTAREARGEAALTGTYRLDTGRSAVPAFELIAKRFIGEAYAPEQTEGETGIPASTTRRIAAEIAAAAFEGAIELDIPWTDSYGERHEKTFGRPVSMHAMRGISAHANGFHTCRLLHLLQILIGSIDCPGGFRYKPPYPARLRHRTSRPASRDVKPNTPLERRTARLHARAGGSADRRERAAHAHRQSLFVGCAAFRARPAAHGHHQCCSRRPVSDRRSVHVHGQHELELVDEHRLDYREPDRPRRRDRRIQDPEDHLL